MNHIDERLHVFSVGTADYAVSTEYLKFAAIEKSMAEKLKSGEPAELALNLLSVPAEHPKQPRFLFAPPDSLVLMLTYACNMNCCYCCQGEIPNTSENKMSEDMAFKSVDWLIRNSKDSETVSIGFFGGEPLLQFELMKRIAAYTEKQTALSGKKVCYGIMTNGLLLDGEVIDFFAEHKVDVSVSFDGPADIQNRNRPLKGGGDSYEVIAGKIHMLLERCPDAMLRATLYVDTDIDSVLRTAYEMGFRHCRIEKVSSSLLDDGKKNDENLSSSQMIEHLFRQGERFLEACKTRNRDALLRIAVDSTFIEAVRQALEIAQSGGRRRWFSCGTGRQMLAVSVDGKLYPCPRFLALSEYCVGTLNENGFHGELHQKSLLLHNEDCRSCWARFFCGGACVVEHLGATGSIFRANPDTCRLRKARIETGIHVAAECTREDTEFLKEAGVIQYIKPLNS